LRSREIRLPSLARFVDDYVGEPGASFRRAVAEHFAVGLRTVESELPRAVEHGALSVEVLPGRGAPKAYRVTPGYLDSVRGRGRFPKYIDLVRSRDLPKLKPPWFAVMEALNLAPTDRDNWFVRGFRLGLIAYCPCCLSIKHISNTEGWLPPELWPVCACRPTELDENTGKWVPRHMISAWTMGFFAPDDPPPPTRTDSRPRETLDELLARTHTYSHVS
jgi:hypothetical protein